MTEPETFSKEWFDKHFDPKTPIDIRKASEHIVRAYRIHGICDPQYIANVIAMHTGRGDGQSNFEHKKKWTHEMHVERHKQLHRSLDELVADYIFHTAFFPTDKTINDLMQWAFEQMENPTEKG